MSSQDITNEQFYQFLTQRLHVLTNAQQVCVWVQGALDTWVQAHVDGGSSTTERPASDDLNDSLKQTQPIALENQGGTLLVQAFESDSDRRLAISMFISARESQWLKRVYSDLLNTVCQIAKDFHRDRTLISHEERMAELKSFFQLISNLHATLDTEKLGYHLTNDGRYFLNADRVWLFLTPNSRLVSASGVASVNQRTRSYSMVRQAAEHVMRTVKPFVWHPQGPRTDSEFDKQISCYCESQSIQGMYVVPVVNKDDGLPVAMVVVEFFSPHDRIKSIARLNVLTHSAASAITNSLQHSRIPFRRTLQGIARGLNHFQLRNLARTIIVFALTALLCGALFFVKRDFYITVDGQLRPLVEQHVFAPADGIIESTSARYGDAVAKSEIIVKLVSPEYQLQLKQLQAELDAAQKKLEANQLQRSTTVRESSDEVAIRRLTAEIEQNQLEIDSINESIEFYLRLIEALSVRAPIDGRIITRDVEKMLFNRPVKAGSQLLTIADTEADWHAIFDIPDREMGYLNSFAETVGNRSWAVEYRLRSEFESTYHGRIEQIDSNNILTSEQETVIKAYCGIDSREIGQPRVGQSVRGRIHCGRKSLFFIWTRDIRDFLRANFFWT